MRIVFFGTPDLAATVLEKLCASQHSVCAVITQPDRPRGRGYELTPPPVKVFAAAHGIDIYQPPTLKQGDTAEIIRSYEPDILCVAAYGNIIPEEILTIAPHGAVNVHTSLLPKYRGAAPIQRAIIDGESETGVTIMKMDAGLDTGDMILCRRTPIAENDNFETLHDRLALLGGEALLYALDKIGAGCTDYQKQDGSLSCYAKKITKDDCKIDFSLTARQVNNLIRGLSPIPLAFCRRNGRMLKIISAHLTDGVGKPGEVLSADQGEIVVACGSGAVAVTSLLPEGKGRMDAASFINGRGIAAGDILE